MRKIEVPRDDGRVNELVGDPESYFRKVRDQVQADATKEIDYRLARRTGGLRFWVTKVTGSRQAN